MYVRQGDAGTIVVDRSGTADSALTTQHRCDWDDARSRGVAISSKDDRYSAAWERSPVPLEQDEIENSEVRALAAKLAPAFEEATALFSVPAEFHQDDNQSIHKINSDLNDNDSLDGEMDALHFSEEALRQELELASDFSNLFSQLSPSEHQDFCGIDSVQHFTTKFETDVIATREMNSTKRLDKTSGVGKNAIAEMLDDDTYRVKSVSLSEPMLLPPIAIPLKTPDNNISTISKSSTSTASDFLQEVLISANSISHTSPFRHTSYDPSLNQQYTLSDHFSFLHLQRDDQAWYGIDWTAAFIPPNRSGDCVALTGIIKEFCVSIPDSKLRRILMGIPEQAQHASSRVTTLSQVSPIRKSHKLLSTLSSTFIPLSTPSSMIAVHQLPVRTVLIRIRGDVLCGAVMDAVVHSLQPLRINDTWESSDVSSSALDHSFADIGDGGNCRTSSSPVKSSSNCPVHILKRQGGHLQAIIAGRRASCTHRPYSPSPDGKDDLQLSFQEDQPLIDIAIPSTPPFLLDVQLVTQKSPRCERYLLIRVFYLEDETERYSYDHDVIEEKSGNHSMDPHVSTVDFDDGRFLMRQWDIENEKDLEQCQILREACALIQRVESPRKVKRIKVQPERLRNDANLRGNVLQETVSSHLMQQYQACPSVKEGYTTLPSLNSNDWLIVVASWRWIKRIRGELESRDLCYSTLRTTRFGGFPSLPTLDVHYCSQIRRISREDMVVHLLKSASDLEDYAREAEYVCANMISLLHATFEVYDMEPLALPQPTPLTAYPLDFVVPQQACPPWGQLVMEAMNQVQTWTENGDDDAKEYFVWNPISSLNRVDADQSIRMAEAAVQLVLNAFQRQDDEEKGARLSRKNIQVMDRLVKMQEHERCTIQMIHRSLETCEKAKNAANDFYIKSGGIREVPLLRWSIVVGGATGTCLVSVNYVLFVTQIIPYIGGNKSNLFRLAEVEFTVEDAGAPSLLNPLPTVIIVKRNGKEVYNFRPSSGGVRLKNFLDLIQTIDIDVGHS